MNSESPRVCSLCHSIDPYYAARYSALGKKLSNLVVIQLVMRQTLYPWLNSASEADVAVETPFEGPLEQVSGGAQPAAVKRILDRLLPDVVVSVGYSDSAMRAATMWARRHKAVTLMVADTWRADKRRWLPLEMGKWMWCSWAYEPWGLVVNEAMAAGLPVLVSRQAGCVPELVWRGMNGYDFDPWDAESVAHLMLRMSSGVVDLGHMGEASQWIIANFTPETWADALSDCIHTLAGCG